MEDKIKTIGESLFRFQSAINESGCSLEDYIRDNYVSKWISDEMYHICNIRTTFVNAFSNFCVGEGLFNLEKVMLSIITDPLAHDVEHTPSINYKGHTYLTTHSMIYSKFLACSNPRIKGIFVDSPNIRLEIESPMRVQRGRYLADFSQIDLEIRRDRHVTLDDYYNRETQVLEMLHEDMGRIKDFFERMIIAACRDINERNADDLKKLGVVLSVPDRPFPTFYKDELVQKYGKRDFEERAGTETKSQFFWVNGLLRENYDLVYPYLRRNGSKVSLSDVKSSNIFNYDILAKSIDASTGKQSLAKEIMSGAIREWLFEPIVERIIDNRVLPVRPKIEDGNIVNIDEMGGYGPFLFFVSMKDGEGKPLLPETMGGGIGIERTLYAILSGERVQKIDDVTFFGKNPDSHPLYLY